MSIRRVSRAWVAAVLGAAVFAAVAARPATAATKSREKTKAPAAAAKEKEKPAAQTADFGKLLAALRKEPNKENYLALRAAIVASPKYDPYSQDLEDIRELLQKKEFAQARARIKAAMPNLLLSPRAHLYAFQAAQGLKDTKTAEDERALLAACLKGILSTGEGTREKPYLVTRVEDEYDLLANLKKRSRKQGLVREGGKSLDCIMCTDGSECWFDVTEVFGSLMRRIPSK